MKQKSTYTHINEAYWRKQLATKEWYITLAPYFKKIIISPPPKEGLSDEAIKELRGLREDIYSIVCEYYEKGKLYLGKSGENWDVERKNIEYVVLHHTSRAGDTSLPLLSTIQMIRLYINQYLLEGQNPDVCGQPLWSNHFRGKKIVFYAYHWLIRPDGKAERLLNDNEIGWHAGDWKVNCSSIAIAFSGDFEDKMPSKKMLDAAVKIIRDNYSNVRHDHILGHGETRPTPTACPGKHLHHIKDYITKHVS